jgi:outer membrane immunogenic protein
MRRLLICALAVSPAISAAAADLPARQPAPSPLAPAPVFSWSGFYGGVQAGADFTRIAGEGVRLNRTAAPIGGFVGYNLQISRLVLGLEGGGGAAPGGAGASVISPAPGGFANVAANTNYFGDLRGRLGYAVADRALVYTTGGAAFGEVALDYFNSLLGGLPISVSNSRTGWTAGAGVDYALTDHWIGRLEYRYRDLGRASAASAPVSLTSKAIMIGLIYKFGG